MSFGWAFLIACGSLGLSTGVAVSFWPFREQVYEMGHPVYFLKRNRLRDYLRSEESKRIRAFVWATFCALVSIVLMAICLFHIFR